MTVEAAGLASLNGAARAQVRWESIAEYRRLFDRTVTLNTAWCFPHAALRLETVGFRDVPLDGGAFRTALALLERGFEVRSGRLLERTELLPRHVRPDRGTDPLQ